MTHQRRNGRIQTHFHSKIEKLFYENVSVNVPEGEIDHRA